MGVTPTGLATSAVISITDVGLELLKKYKTDYEKTITNVQDATRVIYVTAGLIALPSVKPGSVEDEISTAAVYSGIPLLAHSLSRMAIEFF